ncbi:MAG: ABC transporter ATP-binding protein/permease [Thermoflexales bacterium]|nr:ABC transporter ATP-binding protein/permease [Thermoflexales bacterium]
MDALRRLFPYLRPYRAYALLSLATLTALVFLDLAIPRLIQRIIDDGIRPGNQDVVLSTAALMLLISLLSAGVAIGNNLFSVRTGEGVARDLRADLFDRIQGFSFGNLDRQRTGLLMVRLTSDVNALKHLTQISLRIGTRAPMMMVGSLLLMIQTSPPLALTLLPLLTVTSLLIGIFIFRMEPLFRVVQQKLDRLNTVLQENIAGARLARGFSRADFEIGKFDAANRDFANHSIRVMRFMSTMQPLLALCVNAGMVVVIWAGGLQAIEGTLSLGQVVAFGNYLLTMMTPLIMMTMLSNTWAAGLASARRVGEVFADPPEVQDLPGARALPEDLSPTLEMNNVRFAYASAGGDDVLHDIALAATPGQTLAILGATGAGKTSLINLIPRFYDTRAGTVRVGGEDIRTVTQRSLRKRIAIVPQEALLFSGTIRENIAYGKPDASLAEIEAAARAAQAHDFISALPEGYDSHVEARGANFSGGQKQRLSIARALLPHPDILILDDSTSAVDVETETRIQDAMALSAASRLTVVVAQRISTVLKADQIIVLEHGQIAARGSHRELLASSPIYREIYDSQLGGGLPGVRA